MCVHVHVHESARVRVCEHTHSKQLPEAFPLIFTQRQAQKLPERLGALISRALLTTSTLLPPNTPSGLSYPTHPFAHTEEEEGEEDGGERQGGGKIQVISERMTMMAANPL